MAASLHVVIVSSYCEREAAWYPITRRIGVGVFQSAASKHRFLGIVESNCSEFFPVADKLILHDYFMNSQLAL